MNEGMDNLKEAEDLTSLVEQHAKEIWALKEQISDQSKELTVLRGTKDVVVRLTNELVRMKKRAEEAEAKINELEGTLGSAQDINDNHQRYNGKLQVRVTELERDNKKLSQQIEDKDNFLDKVRKSGL